MTLAIVNTVYSHLTESRVAISAMEACTAGTGSESDEHPTVETNGSGKLNDSKRILRIASTVAS